VPFKSSVWKKNSPDSKIFVESIQIIKFLDLLNKDPAKRMNIKEVLDHSWLEKFNKLDHKKSVKDGSEFKSYSSLQPGK